MTYLLTKADAVILTSLIFLGSCNGNNNTPLDFGTSDQSSVDAFGDLFVDSTVNTKDSQVNHADITARADLNLSEPCIMEWFSAIFPQQTSSIGLVLTTDLGNGVWETKIDASAGGISMAKNNPWVYVSFKNGTRVDIDDFSAKSSTSWDLSLRRIKIRVNGGDSGSGQGAIAIVPNKTLAEVTLVPSQSEFAVDDFLDDQCNIETDPIGEILTAIDGTTGLWYDYDSNTSKVTPKQDVYVLRLANGIDHIKFVIDTYYDTSGAGGYYIIRWSKL